MKIIILLMFINLLYACKTDLTGSPSSDQYPKAYIPMIQSSFHLTIFDAKTKEPISCGAFAAVTHINFNTELRNLTESQPECDNEYPLDGLFGAPGLFDIVVSKEGYQDYILSGIEVTKYVVDENKFYVNTVVLDIYLEPSPL